MSITQVAIIVHENEQVIKELAQNMHIWVVASEKSKAAIKALCKVRTPEELTISQYDVPHESSKEKMCIIAIGLVVDHHSVFGDTPWLEIQVHGVRLQKDWKLNLKNSVTLQLLRKSMVSTSHD